jgi:hypothetical protein
MTTDIEEELRDWEMLNEKWLVLDVFSENVDKIDEEVLVEVYGGESVFDCHMREFKASINHI